MSLALQVVTVTVYLLAYATTATRHCAVLCAVVKEESVRLLACDREGIRRGHRRRRCRRGSHLLVILYVVAGEGKGERGHDELQGGEIAVSAKPGSLTSKSALHNLLSG